MKRVLRKLIPKRVLGLYHLMLAHAAAAWFGHPSEKMIVIGVTGTNGKSTVVNLTAKILEASGARVGLTSTINFKVGECEWLNSTKMTMLGRFALQRLLRNMVRSGCKSAVIETSSEGIAQYRHRGINYDVTVFTNLTPEHIESHGGFENYKRAKGELFRHLTRMPHKRIGGKTVPKISVVNSDDPNAQYFLQFPADHKIVYTTKDKNARVDSTGSRFVVDGVQFNTRLLGEFNVSNALAAIAVARALGVDLETCKGALGEVEGIPGRLERVDVGQPFTVIVDYAPEPASMEALYRVVNMLPHKRVIHALGSTGGGRDRSRRPVLGRIAASHADVVIVTNEDPYDDDPTEIIEDVARGAEECRMQNPAPGQARYGAGKECRMHELLKILDRRGAIAKALSLAQAGDLVLITGKGAEQAMVTHGGKKVPWDDRRVVRELLRTL